ncbi:glycosyl hydrolase family 5 [Dactylosporangium sp. NBC_01737]|uniref:GH12 family glycosyl hydrolase domain-containing protein n=1 Tax=Dactylosporangium sp. NBC_01737 TaxID=2975959 RepID=UPI002E1268EF|nr:glycosyl hydrolase family 5 [Dactylosporangium sp. NBC_01737]
MTRPSRALATIGLMLASFITAAVAGGGTAQASTQICDKYGSATVQDRYIVMNNRWGVDTPQCVNVGTAGFAITASHNKPTNGAPASYTAIYYGCHYDNCSPHTTLPMQIGKISSATSSVSFSYPASGVYNVSYDIWLDPAANSHGTNKQELMIWFAKRGPIHPVGSRVATATIGGHTWDVWSGFNGSSDVVSYVAQSPITKWNFDVRAFIDNVKTRSTVTNAWYMTSIQAGFEPWVGGTGLAVNDFAANVSGGGTSGAVPPPAPSHTPSSPAPSHVPSHVPSQSHAASAGSTPSTRPASPSGRPCR